jgi:hypothetical protein
MIFDTLAAMADWLNDRQINNNATESQIGDAVNGVGTSPIAVANAVTQDSEEARKARIFANAMQTRTPRSELEASLGSSSSSSSNSSSSSSQSNACNPDPQMLLTLYDPDFTTYYGDEFYDWCGLRWSLAEIQAGTTKYVCPDLYRRETNATDGTNRVWRETWTFDNWAQNNPDGGTIKLKRWWSHNAAKTTVYAAAMFGVGIKMTGEDYTKTAFHAGNYPSDFTNTGSTIIDGFNESITTYGSMYSPGLVIGVPTPSKNNYRITDAMFGTFQLNGMRFTYQRGTGW